jgi:peptide/nickel transport system substrate-binding protein
VQRRTSKEPLDKGGWSLFPYGAPAAEYRDPVFATNLRGNGKDAWFGWPNDEKMEALRNAWMDATEDADRKKLDAQIQARAFETVPFVPLGQYLPPSAYRSNLTGVLKGAVPVERQQVLSDRGAAARNMAHPRRCRDLNGVRTAFPDELL